MKKKLLLRNNPMYTPIRYAAVTVLWVLNGLYLSTIAVSDLFGQEPFSMGTRMSAFTLKDQHGMKHEVNEQVRLVLFCRDKKGNDIVGDALKETAPDYLFQHKTFFVADTSRMPRLIAKFVALPALRKRPYRVLLDRDPSVTKGLPSEKGRVTLLYLRNLAIEAIEFVDNPGDVIKAIELKDNFKDVEKK
jgi:hypothetical protein